MSDEKLRELERRWRETGAAQDEAALLRERVRVGVLPRRQLELAAYLGHPAAQEALGPSVFSEPPAVGWSVGPGLSEEEMARSDFRALLLGLDWWGVPALVRGLCVLARRALPDFEAARPGERRPHAFLEAAERWSGDPSSETLGALKAAQNEVAGAALEILDQPRTPEVNRLLRVLGTIEEPGEIALIAANGIGHRFNQGTRDPRRRVVVELPLKSTQEDLFAELRDSLVPWALGYSQAQP